MTQTEKYLLIKDLCCRLPYKVKIQYENDIFTIDYMSATYEEIKPDAPNNYTINVSEVKPYLFPLSSMTEEQKKEISEIYNYHNYGLYIEIFNHSEGYWDNDTSCNFLDYLWLEDWFNKNHFDYRGLIKKGLAIDATNLHIY